MYVVGASGIEETLRPEAEIWFGAKAEREGEVNFVVRVMISQTFLNDGGRRNW
jgi:hypothetical protein